ncbi:hypothetical protein BGZ98_001241 [Dissophora globulifera]|uniref:Mitochondrial protein M19 n=1 Tax=Dissophora globulifera TaxID=979702 RepID=A0A9P6R7C2_9FUNG|nr:hypothetical protein BGZ98_001241 [Dissophora globulifera]KAG0312613.1 hypothetical protein BGZ99_009372 [Dissophora globulifera]
MSSSVAPSSKAVVGLYRSYLRVISQWPADPIRPTRNMKTALRSQVTDAFRAPVATNELPARIQDAERQLAALQQITHNDNPNYYSKLVDMLEKETAKKNFEAIGKKGPSFFQRLFRTV